MAPSRNICPKCSLEMSVSTPKQKVPRLAISVSSCECGFSQETRTMLLLRNVTFSSSQLLSVLRQSSSFLRRCCAANVQVIWPVKLDIIAPNMFNLATRRTLALTEIRDKIIGSGIKEIQYITENLTNNMNVRSRVTGYSTYYLYKKIDYTESKRWVQNYYWKKIKYYSRSTTLLCYSFVVDSE
eukprot:g82722.t1